MVLVDKRTPKSISSNKTNAASTFYNITSLLI